GARRRDLDDAAARTKSVHMNRSRAVGWRSAIAELSRLVVAPRQDAAITLQCERARVTTRERYDTASRAETHDGNRCCLNDRAVAVPQLARAILPPRYDSAAARRRQPH